MRAQRIVGWLAALSVAAGVACLSHADTRVLSFELSEAARRCR